MRKTALFLVTLLLICGAAFSALAQDEVAIWGGGIPYNTAWSSDGALLAVASSSGLWIYDAADFNAAPRHVYEQTARVRDVVFYPSNPNLLFSISSDGHVTAWDAAAGQVSAVLGSDLPALWDLAISADGSTLAAASGDTIYTWDTASLSQQATIQLSGSTLRGIALSPDGDVLATGGDGAVIRLWDTVSGDFMLSMTPTLTAEVPTRPTALTFTPDGERLMISDDQWYTRIWSIDGELLLEHTTVYQGDPFTPVIEGLDFLPDGRLITAESTPGGGIRIWEIGETLTMTAEMRVSELADLQPMTAGAVSVSPDGQRAAAIVSNWGDAPTVLIVETESLSEIAALPLFDTITSMAISPDGQSIATPQWRAIALRDAVTGEITAELHHGMLYAAYLAFSPDSDKVAACVNDGQMDWSPSIYVWEIGDASGTVEPSATLETWVDEDGAITCEALQFSEDGEGLYFGVDGSQIRYWHLSGTGERTAPFVTVPNYSLRGFKITDNRVITYLFETGQQRVAVYDWQLDAPVELGSVILPALIKPEDSTVYPQRAMIFSPDVSQIAVNGGEDGLTLYTIDVEARTLQELATVESKITAVAYSPDSRCLLTGHADGSVRVWDINGCTHTVGQQGQSADQVSGLIVTDDRVYVLGRDAVIRVWGLE